MNVFDYLFAETKDLKKNFSENSKESLAFDDLYKESTRLASYINNQMGTGNNILLLSPNNSFFIIVYLAIMKSGNTCVPLNSVIEEDTLEYIQKQTDAKIAFVNTSVKVKIPEELNIIDENLLDSYIEQGNENADFSITDNNDPAEIIYTSGSTGKPKGVVLSHGNIIANTSSIVKYFKLTQDDTMLVVMPFHYCYGLSLFHTHLKVGGKIVLNNSFVFIGSVLNDLKKYKCTGFAGVPSHYQILLRKSKSFIKSDFPDLKYVAQAGGKLHKVFMQEFIDNFPNVRFFTMYGQTEATARLSYLPPEELNTKLGSIGKGIPDVELRVVNDHWENVKPGETGEVIAKGKNVMLGYYKDEEMTNQVLVNGWLRTNDLGTVDEDGYIFLIARKVEMLKVAGKRVSAKEIEEAILQMTDVVDCTIEGVDDDVYGEAIKAQIVLNDEARGKITEDDIKKYCFSKLASYKVPKFIVFEKNLKTAATGKKVKQL